MESICSINSKLFYSLFVLKLYCNHSYSTDIIYYIMKLYFDRIFIKIISGGGDVYIDILDGVYLFLNGHFRNVEILVLSIGYPLYIKSESTVCIPIKLIDIIDEYKKIRLKREPRQDINHFNYNLIGFVGEEERDMKNHLIEKTKHLLS